MNKKSLILTVLVLLTVALTSCVQPSAELIHEGILTDINLTEEKHVIVNFEDGYTTLIQKGNFPYNVDEKYVYQPGEYYYLYRDVSKIGLVAYRLTTTE